MGYASQLPIDGDVNSLWHFNRAAGSGQTAPYPGQIKMANLLKVGHLLLSSPVKPNALTVQFH